ncbi:hypothetical protein MMC07_009459, partial [Pseudocyphellaria aurata]|nr:hypothetical protein [Pseudocyphellaria aurata]
MHLGDTKTDYAFRDFFDFDVVPGCFFWTPENASTTSVKKQRVKKTKSQIIDDDNDSEEDGQALRRFGVNRQGNK